MDEYEVDGDKLRAQGYDGAANMSGKHQGVQAHVRQRFPEAVYVHCKSHCLNLAIVHSCKDASVRTLMGTIQDIAFAFDYSAKKLQAFYDQLADDDNTRDALDGRRKLRTLCETRWTSRADSLYTFRVSFPVVVHALEQLQQDGDEKAGQYLAAILRFEFIIALVAAEHILKSTVHLSTFLQGENAIWSKRSKRVKLLLIS